MSLVCGALPAPLGESTRRWRSSVSRSPNSARRRSPAVKPTLAVRDHAAHERRPARPRRANRGMDVESRHAFGTTLRHSPPAGAPSSSRRTTSRRPTSSPSRRAHGPRQVVADGSPTEIQSVGSRKIRATLPVGCRRARPAAGVTAVDRRGAGVCSPAPDSDAAIRALLGRSRRRATSRSGAAGARGRVPGADRGNDGASA